MVEELLKEYIDLPLECDGLTKVINYVLNANNIEHVVHTGALIGPKGGIPHFWIELEDGSYVDYRARMWQGDSQLIPHGVFKPADYPKIEYHISKTEKWEVTELIFKILTYSFPI